MSSGVIRDFAGPFYVSVRILDPTVPSSDHDMYIRLRWLNTVLAVSECRSFAKLWQEKGCSSQAKTWQVKNILMKEFD